MIAGLTDTKYSAPYPTHSGNISVNCCGLSLGSLPMGGLTRGSFLHDCAASSERGVVGGESASTPVLVGTRKERGVGSNAYSFIANERKPWKQQLTIIFIYIY